MNLPGWLIPILFPLLGATIGWATNWLAIKMLFHPRTPVKVGPWQLQGLLPRRQKEIAAQIGHIAEREFFSGETLKSRLHSPAVQRKIHDSLSEAARAKLDEILTKMNPMVRGFVSDQMIAKICDELASALWERIPTFLDKVVDDVGQEVQVEQLIRQRIEEFDLQQLEKIAYEVAAREFRFIEVLGALLGGLIGFAQAGLYLLAA